MAQQPQAGTLGPQLQMAGGVMSVIGAFAGAISQRQTLKFQAELARINEAIAESNARAALMMGQREEQRSRLSTAQMKSTQEVGYAAAGVDLGVGSAARVRTSTDFMGEIDANTIHANAVRAAFGYRTQSTNFGMEASIRSTAGNAVSPWLQAGSSLLTGAGKVAAGWYALAQGSGPGLTTGDFARMDRGPG